MPQICPDNSLIIKVIGSIIMVSRLRDGLEVQKRSFGLQKGEIK